MKNLRVLRRKKLQKLNKRRVKRNANRKRLRIANELLVNLAVHKMKQKRRGA